MGKIMEYGDDARLRVLAGVEKLARTVRVTMGPRGRNVIIGRSIGAPTITKDGVSVAREVVLDDPIEELGCQLVKEAAGRTAALAGDGTTTATVLTYSIFKGGIDLINSGYSPLDFRDGIAWAKSAIVNELSLLSKPVDDDQTLIDVATISVNNDSALGQVVAGAYIAVDRDGSVTAEAHPGVSHSFRVVDGIELKSGYISSGFLDKGETKREMENCVILFCDEEITTLADTGISKAIESIAQLKKDVLIICKDAKKEGLSFLIQNFQAGRLRACVIRTPKFGSLQHTWIEDLAALTGATVIGGDFGVPWENFKISHLGLAKSVVVDSYQTKIVSPNKNEKMVANRISICEEALTILLSDSDRELTLSRLGFLRSKVAVITVGYSTELELRELGDRVEDAMFAVRAAIDEGFVVGGGFALWRAAQGVETKSLPGVRKEWRQAAEVLLEACREPARQIIRNGQLDPEAVLSNKGFLEMLLENPNTGYNTATGNYGDMVSMGVIDPRKVTRTALENAVSIAQLLITTDAVIADNPNNQSGWQPPAGYRLPKDNGLNHKH